MTTTTKPIKIHYADDEKEVRERHARIEQRLDEWGEDQVRSMHGHGYPSQWQPIVTAWLAGRRLEPEEKSDAKKAEQI